MKLFVILILSLNLFSDTLSLEDAKNILEDKNLEIYKSRLNERISKLNIEEIKSKSYGSLNYEQDVVKSNDAGNIFGFKLKSREASFGDFGFAEFDSTNPNILNVTPKDLNNPKTATFYQSKLVYGIPLFTGFKLQSYDHILKYVSDIRKLQTNELILKNQIEVEKIFYDLKLLKETDKMLSGVLTKNINFMENLTMEMVKEGYATKIDVVEVAVKKQQLLKSINNIKFNEKLLKNYLSFLLNMEVQDVLLPYNKLIVSKKKSLNIDNNKIRIAEKNLKIKKSIIEVEKSSFYPTIVGFAEVGTSSTGYMFKDTHNNYYNMGLKLKLNLFNGGVDSINKEKASLEYLKATSDLIQSTNYSKLKIDQLLIEINSINSDLTFLNKELEYNELLLENFNGRYKERLIPMTDLVVKTTSVIESILKIQEQKNKRNKKIFELKEWRK